MLKIAKSKKDSFNNEVLLSVSSTIADDNYLSKTYMPIVYPSDLIGRTFIIPTNKNKKVSLSKNSMCYIAQKNFQIQIYFFFEE